MARWRGQAGRHAGPRREMWRGGRSVRRLARAPPARARAARPAQRWHRCAAFAGGACTSTPLLGPTTPSAHHRPQWMSTAAHDHAASFVSAGRVRARHATSQRGHQQLEQDWQRVVTRAMSRSCQSVRRQSRPWRRDDERARRLATLRGRYLITYYSLTYTSVLYCTLPYTVPTSLLTVFSASRL